MSNQSDSHAKEEKLSRRKFFKVGGLVVGGGALAMSCGTGTGPKHKILGRTGYKVSDIALGGTRNTESSVVRYAFDKGVN